MTRRSLSTVGLLITLLLGTWSNVIAAAFCPRYLSNRDCCVKHVESVSARVSPHESCHHEMSDPATAEMDNMIANDNSSTSAVVLTSSPTPSTSTLESSSEQPALDLPVEQCPHCWSHSQPTSESVIVAASDPAKSLIETYLPIATPDFGSLSPLTDLIDPLEHGPPGLTLPRHVLINVFRI